MVRKSKEVKKTGKDKKPVKKTRKRNLKKTLKSICAYV